MLKHGHAAGYVGEPETSRIVAGILGRTTLYAERVKLGQWRIAGIVASGCLHQQGSGTDRPDLLKCQKGMAQVV